jgi:hypothetical protein
MSRFKAHIVSENEDLMGDLRTALSQAKGKRKTTPQAA